MHWQDRAFDELSARELYVIVELRERVFVVEQRCVYLDADGLDPQCRHVTATAEGALLAYLRVVPAGARYPEAALGRIVTAPAARGTGLGKELVQRAVARYGGAPLRLAAQAHLERFYAGFGFARIGEPFDEDGIPHLYMLR